MQRGYEIQTKDAIARKRGPTMDEAVQAKHASDYLSFADVSRASLNWGTHSYHSYPMRFVPHLAREMIERYSRPGEVIADPFMGSGTVLVEAMLLGRPSMGIDINPVAVLIAQAKTTIVEPEQLHEACDGFANALMDPGASPLIPEENLNRIQWWFPEHVIHPLGVLNSAISSVAPDLQPLFKCAFSSILKQCSLWSPHSIKPIRSEKRHRIEISDPFTAMAKKLARIQKANAEAWASMGGLQPSAQTRRGDARSLTWPSDSIDLVVTSPPYLTAYDCSEVFELTLLWMGVKPKAFRNEVIGSRVLGEHISVPATSCDDVWLPIVESLKKGRNSTGTVAHRFYYHMYCCLTEIVRVLRPHGVLVLVTGDSRLRGIDMRNAWCYEQILRRHGLAVKESFTRTISGRSLPPARDPLTGRFLKSATSLSSIVYATETVLAFQK